MVVSVFLVAMIVIMIIMFYFLLIRPQQRQRKEQAARIASMRLSSRAIWMTGAPRASSFATSRAS